MTAKSKWLPNKTLLCTGFLVLALGNLIAFLLNQSEEEKRSREMRPGPARQASSSIQSPALPRYELKELFLEHANQKLTTDQSPVARHIAVTGRVIQFQRHLETMAPQADVILTTDLEDPRIILNCLLGDSEPWNHVAPYQTVTIEGDACELDSGTLVLGNAKIVAVEGEPCPLLTADELSSMLASGEFHKKYHWKGLLVPAPHVILSGRIKDVRSSSYYTDDSSEVEVVLESSGSLEICCLFENSAPRLPTKENLGHWITVVGERKGQLEVNPVLQRCFQMSADSPFARSEPAQ